MAIAGALWSGFCGLRDRVKPLPQARGAGWDIEPRGVAQNLEEALTQMRKSKFLRDAFGNRFVDLYAATKRSELENYKHVVSSWERKFLLHTA